MLGQILLSQGLNSKPPAHEARALTTWKGINAICVIRMNAISCNEYDLSMRFRVIRMNYSEDLHSYSKSKLELELT